MSKTMERWLKEDVSKLEKISKEQYYAKDFFRDPLRVQTVDSNFFYSPADGIILYQKEVRPDEEIIEVKGRQFTLKKMMENKDWNKRALVIGIFMSQYDVHVNRIPYAGLLNYQDLPPLSTSNRPMIFEEKDIFGNKVEKQDLGYVFYNQRTINTVYVPRLNYEYFVVQFADKEVDCISHFYNKQGKLMVQNQRFAMIRYGSQVDLVLPITDGMKFKTMQKETCHVKAGLDKLVEITK